MTKLFLIVSIAAGNTLAQNCKTLSGGVDFVTATPCSDSAPIGRRDGNPKLIVIHTTQNPSGKIENDIRTFLDGSTKSIHYIVGQDGSIVQMAKESDVTYHAGNDSYSRTSIGIEHVAYCCANPKKDNLGAISADAYARMQSVSGALVRNILAKYNISAKRVSRADVVSAKKDPSKLSGLISHADIPGGDKCGADKDGNRWGGQSCHTDPGEWDWDRYMKLVTDVPGDFRITYEPIVIPEIKRGAEYSYPMLVIGDRLFGFPINIGISNVPVGMTATASPVRVLGPLSSISKWSLVISNKSAAAGRYNINISGAGGGLSRTTTVPIVVAQESVVAPTFSPSPGVFQGAVSVSLISSTSGASIRYTTNGSDPSSGSTIYSSPIRLTSTTMVKARAFKSGMSDSPVVSGTFTVQPLPPPLTARCSASPNPVKINKTITWTANASGGSGSFTYAWLNGTKTATYSKTYATVQTVDNFVTITDTKTGSSKRADCRLSVVK